MEYKDPGRYIPIIYLLYSWGSRFGVPSRVPLSIDTHNNGLMGIRTIVHHLETCYPFLEGKRVAAGLKLC